MKKATLFATALACACLLVAGAVSAQAQQRTPVAGYSPKLAYPQPSTGAILAKDANRLIRWQGWLKVDAFSISVLEQMQKQLGRNIEVGKFTIAEESIAKAVAKAMKANPTFEVNPYLEEGENLTNITLYVWTYRHNYTDTGLYQLYVSARGQMLIGTQSQEWDKTIPILHEDIQALGYEFSNVGQRKIRHIQEVPVYADVEIWRGAVVRVNARGEITMVGNEAGARPLVGDVEVAPMSDWEIAPSLEGNPNFSPRAAFGAGVVAPLNRAIKIPENSVQKATGRYVPPPIVFRSRLHGR